MTQLAGPAPPGAGPTTGPHWARFIRTRAGGLPRAFWALWAGTLVNRIGYLVQPFLAYYLTGHRGLSVSSHHVDRHVGVRCRSKCRRDGITAARTGSASRRDAGRTTT